MHQTYQKLLKDSRWRMLEARLWLSVSHVGVVFIIVFTYGAQAGWYKPVDGVRAFLDDYEGILFAFPVAYVLSSAFQWLSSGRPYWRFQAALGASGVTIGIIVLLALASDVAIIEPDGRPFAAMLALIAIAHWVSWFRNPWDHLSATSTFAGFARDFEEADRALDAAEAVVIAVRRADSEIGFVANAESEYDNATDAIAHTRDRNTVGKSMLNNLRGSVSIEARWIDRVPLDSLSRSLNLLTRSLVLGRNVLKTSNAMLAQESSAVVTQVYGLKSEVAGLDALPAELTAIEGELNKSRESRLSALGADEDDSAESDPLEATTLIVALNRITKDATRVDELKNSVDAIDVRMRIAQLKSSIAKTQADIESSEKSIKEIASLLRLESSSVITSLQTCRTILDENSRITSDAIVNTRIIIEDVNNKLDKIVSGVIDDASSKLHSSYSDATVALQYLEQRRLGIMRFIDELRESDVSLNTEGLQRALRAVESVSATLGGLSIDNDYPDVNWISNIALSISTIGVEIHRLDETMDEFISELANEAVSRIAEELISFKEIPDWSKECVIQALARRRGLSIDIQLLR